MNRNQLQQLTIFSVALLVSCNPKGDGITSQVIDPTPATNPAPVETNDGLLPDSIITYRPAFGKSSTVRHYPFSTVNQPDIGVRLTKVFYNGKLVRMYEYNAKQRLAVRTDYSGSFIYRKFVYTYANDELVKIDAFLNKSAQAPESSPTSNELLPSMTTTYRSTGDTIAWVDKTIDIEFLGWEWDKQRTTRSYGLGFSPLGALIWEQEVDAQGKVSNYTLWKRNELGNVVFQRYGSWFHRWQVTHFTYDNKRNPFSTTGDLSQFGDNLIINMGNINNIVTLTSTGGQGYGKDSWRYEYDYRPDGYPSRMKVYRFERLDATVDFEYNQ